MPETSEPAIVVVFRSRRRAENEEAYREEAARIGELARQMPGYVSHKGFRADDGENVTIVEFETMAHVEAWRRHPEHAAAKARGRSEFYAGYSITIAEVTDQRSWP